MPLKPNPPHDIAVEGGVCLTCGSDWCQVSGAKDAVELTASSLRALEKLAPVGKKTLARRLLPLLSRTNLKINVFVGRHLIARIGPHATAGRFSRLLGFGPAQMRLVNLLRVRLGLYRRLEGAVVTHDEFQRD